VNSVGSPPLTRGELDKAVENLTFSTWTELTDNESDSKSSNDVRNVTSPNRHVRTMNFVVGRCSLFITSRRITVVHEAWDE
jgi:hypothetical protein